MTTSDSNLSLTYIEVKNLFGRFNHQISFNSENNINIISAPNGFGKTIILQIIHSVFNNQFSFLHRIEFSKIDIGIGNDLSLIISKMHKNDDELISGIEFQLCKSGKFIEGQVHEHTLSFHDIEFIERHLRLKLIEPDKWFDYRSETELSLDQIIKLYNERLPDKLKKLIVAPEWLQEIIEHVSVHMLGTQRLRDIKVIENNKRYPRTSTITYFAVNRDAEDLSRRIGRILQDYANEALKIDMTFPDRILKHLEEVVSDEKKIKAKLDSLIKRQDELISVGLLGSTISEPIQPTKIPQEKEIQKILEIYVEDTSKKLDIFDSIFKKVSLFKQILENRFFFKKIIIDPENGFQAIDNDNDQPIPLSELSSGEQHILVLIYLLLFSVEEDSIILIDEPELSLHISLQRTFIEDLEKILKLRQIRVIIATHSPQIINDKWDYVQQLNAKS